MFILNLLVMLIIFVNARKIILKQTLNVNDQLVIDDMHNNRFILVDKYKLNEHKCRYLLNMLNNNDIYLITIRDINHVKNIQNSDFKMIYET